MYFKGLIKCETTPVFPDHIPSEGGINSAEKIKNKEILHGVSRRELFGETSYGGKPGSLDGVTMSYLDINGKPIK